MRTVQREMACLFGVALCATIGLGVAHAQSGTGTSAATASQRTEANRAFKLLASTLTSNCGTGSYFDHGQDPDAVPKVVITSSVRIQDGILSIERLAQGLRKTYRVRLGELRPSADRRPQTALVGGDLLFFPCQKTGCATTEGVSVMGLEIAVCSEKREDVLKAMQVLIQEAGGPKTPLK